MDELLDIEPPGDEDMYQLYWDLLVLDLPLYQRSDGQVDSSRTYCSRLPELGFLAGYIRPPTNHDFRAEGLHLTGQ